MFTQTLAHPWHGIEIGENAPDIVSAFIEIVPTDTVKYEIDKTSGFLKVDRPQKYSSLCPALYGFIPRTICLDNVAKFSMEKTGIKNLQGDQDPIDICVLTERPINHAGIIVHARPIGGFRLLDGGEADDKIIAVIMNDAAYGSYKDIQDVPQPIIYRLKHYFLTYKQNPNLSKDDVPACTIEDIYGRDEAKMVIKMSMVDYEIYINR